MKLLRFLESKSIERLGSSKTIEVDARLVCATNRNLQQMVKKGDFREDLFYRLNVVSVNLPSLCERGDDIVLLLHHFIRYFAEENGFDAPMLEEDAIATLLNYKWPGNVRELRNFCENLVVLKRGTKITNYDLDPRFTIEDFDSETGGTISALGKEASTNSLSVEENEKRLLRNALIQSRGNKTKAAELMGISRRTLHRKLARWPELEL